MKFQNDLEPIHGTVRVEFQYAVHFTENVFAPSNALFRDVVKKRSERDGQPLRVFFVLDADVERLFSLQREIVRYCDHHRNDLHLAGDILNVVGGEAAKNDPACAATIQSAVNDTKLDRHSYLVAIGGGALLDVAGFAAATAHRGVRLIRLPTTVLAQDDSGVGVKNGINAFGKKNFLGTFAPAWAVINDYRFLEALPDRDWRSGIAEAVKVALIKDQEFFGFLEQNAPALINREKEPMRHLLRRCAELHVHHICDGGDPFEMGSSRPLDFGHWSAHKLEQLTGFKIRHGEAVAFGIALDSAYSHLTGFLDAPSLDRIIKLLLTLGFDLALPPFVVSTKDQFLELLAGLQEFREHLGGRLTVQMLRAIGTGFNVNEINQQGMRESLDFLQHQLLTECASELLAV